MLFHTGARFHLRSSKKKNVYMALYVLSCDYVQLWQPCMQMLIELSDSSLTPVSVLEGGYWRLCKQVHTLLDKAKAVIEWYNVTEVSLIHRQPYTL